jgi:hypothetical protein
MKVCNRCHRPGRLAGTSLICNSCRSANNKVTLSTHLRSYIMALLRGGARRGERRDLTTGDVIAVWRRQRGRCALTGVLMTHAVGSGACNTNLSIDRIDPLKGYTADNIQLTCAIANWMRREMSIGQYLDWCSLVVAHHRDDCQTAGG